MATYTKYNQFVEDVAQKVHDFFGTAGSTADTFKVALTNTAPNVSTHVVLADITEISAVNGYSAGGPSATNVGTRSSGTVTVAGTNAVVTASGGTVGPFRYAVLYNSTPGAPVKPLIAYWDYGSSISLNDTESFTVAFGSGTIFTLA
jgi:hypothetical protein